VIERAVAGDVRLITVPAQAPQAYRLGSRTLLVPQVGSTYLGGPVGGELDWSSEWLTNIVPIVAVFVVTVGCAMTPGGHLGR
jgi:hypothetical protein